GGLAVGNGLERGVVVAAREGKEALLRRRTVGDISLEDALDRLWGIDGLDVAIKLAAEHGVRAEPAADQDVIAFDLLAVLGFLHFAGEQPDFADEVLGAGVMAPGEMDVDRRVDLYARLAPGRTLVSMALGVGRGELASGISGAGDEAGAQRIRPRAQTERLDCGASCRDLRVRHAGDKKILPHRKADFAVAILPRDRCDAAHL